MGYLEGKLTGLGWEGAIRQKIFAPLGMSHSDLSVTEIEKTDDHMGVVILTNLPNGQTPEVLAYNVYDRLLGLDPMPWFDRFKDLEAKSKKQEDEAKKNKPTDRKTVTHPSHNLAYYAGEYQNEGYGMIKVALKGDGLALILNKLGPYPLEHYHYDIFQVPEENDSFAAGEKFQFEMNKKGDMDRIAATLEPSLGEDIIFTRAPEKISKDVLQKLTGDYLLNELTITFAVVGDALRLTVPGQPQYELIPWKELSFDLKGMPGFSVDFQLDASGKVTEAIVNQPNGVFHAKRK